MSSVPWIMAIDFGTSYTVAAGLAEGRAAEVIEIQGERRTPSVILVEGPSRFIVGRVADDLSGTNPQDVLRAPKSRLGDQAPAVMGGRPYQVVELVAALLAQVYQEGVRQFGGPPHEVRLTHPATWNRPRLLRLVEAAAKAGINDPVLVPEPVAAALSYWQAGELPDGGHVAIYDLGGGTFDTAVVRAEHGAFHVVGRAGGDATVGGELFDEILANYIGEGLDAATWEAVQLGNDPGWRQAGMVLRNEARRAKETLSAHAWADVLIPLPAGALQRRVNREEFEELIEPYVDETVGLLGRCIADCGLKPSDMTAIQLVGGASRIPLVERAVSEAFPSQTVHRRGDPKTAVALGALLATGPSTTPIAAMGAGSTEDLTRTGPPTPVPGAPLTPIPHAPAAATALPGGLAPPRSPGGQPVIGQPVVTQPVVTQPVAAPAVTSLPTAPPPSAPPPSTPTTPISFTPPPGAPKRKRGPLIAAGAIVGALALGGGVLLLTGGGGSGSSDSTVAPTSSRVTATTGASSTTRRPTTSDGTDTTDVLDTIDLSDATDVIDTIDVTDTTGASVGPVPKPPGLQGLETMKGVIPFRAYSQDFANRLATTDHGTGLADYSYAAEAYDAFVTIALAAEAAQTDATDLANFILYVVQEGQRCTTYSQCKELVDQGVDIDYDGESGPLTMSTAGDLIDTSFLVSQFGSDSHIDHNFTTARAISVPPGSAAAGEEATGNHAGDDHLVIGGLMPLSGQLAFLGDQMAAGVELALAEVNAAGGALGFDVTLELRDSGDGSSEDTIVNAANELLASDVSAVVGPATAGDVPPVLDLFTGAGVAMVSPGAWDDSLSSADDHGLFFRTAPALSVESQLLAQLVAEDENRTVYIVVSDDSFGDQIGDGMSAAFDQQPGVTVLGLDRYAPSTTVDDYASKAAEIASTSPDAIIFCGSTVDIGVFQALVGQGLGPSDINVYGCRTDMQDVFGDAYLAAGG